MKLMKQAFGEFHKSLVKAELSTWRYGCPQVSCRLLYKSVLLLVFGLILWSGWMEWIPLAETRNVGLVTKIPTAEYLSAWQVLGNLEIAEVLRDYVASNPQREQICLWTAMLRVHYQSHDSWTPTCLFSFALVSANRKLFMFMSHTLQHASL